VLIASYGNKLGWTDIKILIGFVVAIAALIALVISENKAETVGTALLPWNLFKTDSNFVKIFALAFVAVFLGMAHPVFLVLFLQKVALTSATVSGIPFSLVSIASLIAAPCAAKIFQKTGKIKNLMAIAAILMTLPMLFYGLWLQPEIGNSSVSLMILYVTSFIYGIGGIITMTLPYNACSAYLPKESVGVASANVYMAVNLGGSVGLAILQAIYNAVNNSAGMNTAIKTVFICASVGGVIACLLSLSLKKK
jgi:MFS family permease